MSQDNISLNWGDGEHCLTCVFKKLRAQECCENLGWRRKDWLVRRGMKVLGPCMGEGVMLT